MRALEAVNSGTATDSDRKILKVVGGTAFRHGRFELALNVNEVGKRLKRAPGIVQDRIDSEVAVNKADFSGNAGKNEDERPKRQSPFRLPGVLAIGRRGKIKPNKQTS